MYTKISKIAVCFILLGWPLLVLAGDPTPGADADLDGAPDTGRSHGAGSCLVPIPPANLLVDRAHGGDFDVSGLTEFLVSQDWTVDELSTPVTPEALAGYHVFLIPSRVGGLGEFPSIDPYTADEVAAVVAFVANDHGLWCLTEFNRDQTGVNTVANQFGVTFYADAVIDPVDNVDGGQLWPLIQMIEVHPITFGVDAFGYYAGCCVGSENPAVVVATGGPHASSDNCPEFPPVLAVYENGGRAVFCGDATPLYPGYDITEDHWRLLANIAEWLATGQVVPTEPVSWSGAKRLYR